VRAVVFDGPERVRVDDVAEPAIRQPGDALVEISLTAICGSDLHVYDGKLPVEPGDALGHEAVGVVREVGPEVTTVAPGDRVVVAWSNVCGRCWYCSRRQTALCEHRRLFGFGTARDGLDGLQAERARVPRADGNLLRIPEGVDDTSAVMVGDILTTSHYGSVLADPADDETVAIVGMGPVGQLCAMTTRIRGATRVLAIDIVPDRLELAESAGAIPILVSSREEATDAVRALTGGRGADATIEAAGNLAAFDQARSITRPGGRIVLLGVYGPERTELRMGSFWNRAVDILFAGMCPVHALWEEVMGLVEEGRLDPSTIVSHRLPLEEAPEGYDLFAGRRATKVVLEV